LGGNKEDLKQVLTTQALAVACCCFRWSLVWPFLFLLPAPSSHLRRTACTAWCACLAHRRRHRWSSGPRPWTHPTQRQAAALGGHVMNSSGSLVGVLRHVTSSQKVQVVLIEIIVPSIHPSHFTSLRSKKKYNFKIIL
jgi:hypothetical protein